MNNTYYQFVIYDSDREDCYCEDGVIVEVSNLYTTKEACEYAANAMVEDFAVEYADDGRFQYEIISVEVVK